MERHRKIYEHCYGPIPVDEDGRSFDIDHLDGNHANNHPANLDAKPIKNHYQKHYNLGEWSACLRIASRMDKTPDELSELATLANLERVRKGIHPFLGGEVQRQSNQERIKNGTHNWLDKEDASKRNQKRIEAGTHNFLNKEWQKTKAKSGKQNSNYRHGRYCGGKND
jgi:HNH endonuclease